MNVLQLMNTQGLFQLHLIHKNVQELLLIHLLQLNFKKKKKKNEEN